MLFMRIVPNLKRLGLLTPARARGVRPSSASCSSRTPTPTSRTARSALRRTGLRPDEGKRASLAGRKREHAASGQLLHRRARLRDSIPRLTRCVQARHLRLLVHIPRCSNAPGDPCSTRLPAICTSSTWRCSRPRAIPACSRSPRYGSTSAGTCTRQRASSAPSEAADGGVPLGDALRAFARFVGDDGALLSWGDEGGWLEESCLRAGLPCLVDPLRFADAAPVLRKGVGAGEHAPLPTVVSPSLPHDALHEARALARTLRWLHARGRL